MAPLRSLSEDNIVEASLLESMGDEFRASPTSEEEATLLGEDLELPEALEAAASLQECPENPKPEEPTEQIYTLSTPAPSSPTPKPCCLPSQKTKKSWQGIESKSLPTPNPDIINNWIQSYIEKSRKVPNSGGNSSPFTEPLNDIQVNDLAFRLPFTQPEKSGWWSALPCLGVLG